MTDVSLWFLKGVFLNYHIHFENYECSIVSFKSIRSFIFLTKVFGNTAVPKLVKLIFRIHNKNNAYIIYFHLVDYLSPLFEGIYLNDTSHVSF